MKIQSMVLGILIGIVSIVAITALTIAIGCAINGITFGQQIVNWFAPKVPTVVETVKSAI